MRTRSLRNTKFGKQTSDASVANLAAPIEIEATLERAPASRSQACGDTLPCAALADR